jgi:hypothetical protein
MGLDMYLYAEQYVSGYDFQPEERSAKYKALVELFGAAGVVDENTPSAFAKFTVGYWRKANAIHQWFVDNVQNGVDDCGNYYVGREQLLDLRETCKAVLNSLELEDGKVYAGRSYKDGKVEDHYVEGKVATNDEVAKELLPAQDGFFFGGTDYDEWYAQCLQDTADIIDRVLDLGTEWDFEYHSSW